MPTRALTFASVCPSEDDDEDDDQDAAMILNQMYLRYKSITKSTVDSHIYSTEEVIIFST